MLFQLLARRYGRGSIILTTTKGFREWAAITGGGVLASAILDRLPAPLRRALSINGPRYRLRGRFLTPPEPPMPESGRRRNDPSGPYALRHMKSFADRGSRSRRPSLRAVGPGNPRRGTRTVPTKASRSPIGRRLG